MVREWRRALVLAAVILGMAAGGCAALPTPALQIEPQEVTYLSVGMAEQHIGLYMTEIVAGGAFGDLINNNNRSQSKQLWDKVKADPRVQSLPDRLRDQILARAKAKGVVLADARQLNGRPLKQNEQQISLVNAIMQYWAATWVSTYAPMGVAMIESSRDPAIPEGRQRAARMAMARIDDSRYSFLTAGGVLDNPAVAIDGAILAADALAEQVAQDLAAAQRK